MTDILGVPETALAWRRAGQKVALATVVDTWGSAPRRCGAQMVVSSEGEMEGSVSGGCVEGAVIVEALEVIETGCPRIVEYGVSDGDAFAVGLACGGKIRILIEPITSHVSDTILTELVVARKARRAVAYVVDAQTGQVDLAYGGYGARFRMDRSGFEDDGRFVTIHNPPLRMVIVGAVHIAQVLVPMAKIAGFDPIVVDPRTAFGSALRFPGETIIEDWPDDALEAIGLDGRTAVVLLTHDPKLDDPALKVALLSAPFYIGALGSKKTQAARIARLEAVGFTTAQIERVHGPVGLDIGAANPAEIAVSILSEVTQVLRMGAKLR